MTCSKCSSEDSEPAASSGKCDAALVKPTSSDHKKDTFDVIKTAIQQGRGSIQHSSWIFFANRYKILPEGKDGDAVNRLVSGVPSKASLSFEVVAPQTSRLSLLEIGCYGLSMNAVNFRAQLHNIPLSR